MTLPPFKDGNARFTLVPFKALSDEIWTYRTYIIYPWYMLLIQWRVLSELDTVILKKHVGS